MPKKFRNELEALNADQVTEKLGDWCEKMDGIMTDRNKDRVTTLFNGVAFSIQGRSNTLADAAARKNGVEYKGSDFEYLLEAIADAAEARGGKSAAKVREHVQLVKEVKEATRGKGYKETLNPLQTARYAMTAMKEFKTFG